jgi:hypothetical protein
MHRSGVTERDGYTDRWTEACCWCGHTVRMEVTYAAVVSRFTSSDHGPYYQLPTVQI